MQPIRLDLMLSSHPIDDMGCPVDVLVSDLPESISVHGWKDTVVQPLDSRPASGALLYRDSDGAWKRPDSDVTWPEFWKGRPRTDALLLSDGHYFHGSPGGTVFYDVRYLTPEVLDVLRARPFYFSAAIFIESGVLHIADDGVLRHFVNQVKFIVKARFKFMERLIWLDFCWRSLSWRFVLHLEKSFEERSSGRMDLGHYDNVHVAVRQRFNDAKTVDLPELVTEEAERLTMQIEDMNHLNGWRRKMGRPGRRYERSPTTLLGRLCARLVDSDEPQRMSTVDYEKWYAGKNIRLTVIQNTLHVGGYWNRTESNDLESSLEFDTMISTTTPRHFASFDAEDDQAWLDTQYKRAIRHRPRRE